jgi:lipopolysaccharide transport protein LptA/LPS export ABC transporter protein LptC
MKNRNIIVYASIICIALCLASALYFFVKKPEKIAAPVLEEGKKAVVFKDVRYSGEKKGVLDWEIKAKVARKFIDKPEVEMEEIEGRYTPRADVSIAFKGAKGIMNTEAERGVVEDVDILYKNEYRMKSRFMDFDFKRGLTTTTAPVDIKGSRLTLRGVGLTANTNEESVRIEKDVTGFIETDKGRYKFEADHFLYRLKENVYILDGKVVMKGEEMNLLCDNLHILSKGQEIERIVAKGKVRLISKGTITKSEKAVYNLKEEKVVLTESPRILKDNVEMEGEAIVYNLASGRFSIDKPRMRLER